MALMFVLIATIFVTAMGAALIEAIVIETRQSRVDEWGAQADWLVAAAANRAAAQLANDTSYQGETWQIEAARLGGRHAAEVEIGVDIAGDVDATQLADITVREVAITARYPTDTPIFVSREQTITISFGNTTVNKTDTQAAEDAP